MLVSDLHDLQGQIKILLRLNAWFFLALIKREEAAFNIEHKNKRLLLVLKLAHRKHACNSGSWECWWNVD